MSPDAAARAPAVESGADAPRPRHASRTTAAILGLLILLPFAAQLIHPAGTVLGQRHCDNPSFFYFFNHYTGLGWRNWELPFWNPHIMLGVPFLAEGQGAFFHPFSLLYALLPTGMAINWHWALGAVLTGLGFWGFGRSLDISRPAAFCGALTWSFSSAVVGIIYAGHLNRMLGFVSLPFILMFWERFRRDRRIGNLAGLAVAYALLIFAGFPQFTFIFSLFILCYVGGTALLQFRSLPAMRREASAIGMLALAVIVGIGLAAVQLLPSMDFAANSFRSKSSYNFCTSFSFAPENVITLVCPRFFGTLSVAGDDQYWGRNFFWEMWVYAGIVPLIAAAGGIFRAPRRRVAVLLSCAAAFFIVGLGKHTPMFRILYDHVPGFDLFRAPAKFTLVSLFCLVTLAAYGLDAWCGRFQSAPPKLVQARRRKPKHHSSHTPVDWSYRASLATALGLFLLALVLYAYYVPGHDATDSNWADLVKWREAQGENYSGKPLPDDPAFLTNTGARAATELFRAMILALLAAGALVLAKSKKWKWSPAYAVIPLIVVDLTTFAAPYATRFDESITRYPDGMLDALADEPFPPRIFDPRAYANQGMLEGTSSIGGYCGNTLTRYNDFINLAEGRRRTRSRLNTPIRKLPAHAEFLAVAYRVVPAGRIPDGMEVLAKVKGRALVRDPAAFPRAFLATAPHRFDDAEAALQYVLDGNSDLRASPAIESAELLPQGPPLTDAERVDIAEFGPNRVVLNVRSQSPRILVLNEMHYKDWTASIDGHETPILPANYLFRGVVVPAGASTVVFAYRSAALTVGLWVTIASIVLLLAGVSGLLPT